MARLLGDLARAGLLSAAPLLALVALCGAAAFLMLGGWTLSTKAFAPDAARLNPVRLVKNVFSVRGLGELVKAILKALVLGGLAAWALHLFLADITGLAALPLATSVQHALRVIGWSWLVLVGGLALIAAVDVPFELWRHYSGLKMSRREVRDELKETEGDPQIRARVRSAQRDAARRRMMAAVPKADVIVTNPTHFAVALAYTETMRAPRVVAKGADLLAARIRELGVTHGVPTLEAPALARALYRHVPLEREVPQALYEAVALVMAYVFQLRAGRGGALPPPAALPVPQALDPGVQA
ncbi:MAG: flagellar type III secretion system protein FlhB [Burkholderiales bacterium]|nr:flagellar type III secretion system protein FlhB [Burkholderiales bacterium]